MLLLNTVEAVAWAIMLAIGWLTFELTAEPLAGFAAFISSYPLLITLAEVCQEWLIERFNSKS